MTDIDLAAMRERLEFLGRDVVDAALFSGLGDRVYADEDENESAVDIYATVMNDDLPALLAEVERLREIAREAQRVREMLDSDDVGGVDWFNLSMVLDGYRLEATHD